ncbi:hypothetical protein B2J86_05990 [Acidovorax sp. SRB_14]|uniref:hypothetical protein n=1 Tax=unclassified Acidovorax TaxID=2684926 RepID=UPI00145EB48C|nr:MULTISPECIES: hypothetical protein [unclassified Acidovorax]NMM77089.1 hypothetical protein [Acidovorax sp. SRB_24]NMM80482.1 hypothetical protein [Acidovorax sp. SRB_14]NMM85124.1 hypothetical protein [Rhodococcus sp. SRB_17]
MSSFLRHHAPAVRYPVARGVWLGWALVAYATAGFLALLAWALWGAGTRNAMVGAAGVLWLGCCALALHFWCSWRPATLAWNGSHWSLEAPAGAIASPATIQVHLDLQRCLWVRLQPVLPHPVRAHWLWLEQRSAPEHWGELRRAVYSRARQGAGDISSHGPRSGPQA